MAPSRRGMGDERLNQKIQCLKRNMAKISMDQLRIREEQISVRQKFAIIKQQCQQLRKEINLISKQASMTQIRLAFMFQIIRARKDGNFSQAAKLTHSLRFIV
ncbi:hypothetical protein E1A91_D13G150000v1 [Gossypium mustelinum]|uniref:Uncharacterized protein n=4 Tax=Gossypium TaxID=3633 RepID=A0A0D2U1D0_GOSRA|nr:hypothetical protein ES319_D13G146400v1 [Gossypium barbadense]KJB81413.1 hypothetical protein B456_013G144400 [Gossypium raimondii]PPD82873.1 hypothetical protein GOBAR_DD20181 [Gossypium barbadense]TYG37627.1 hypothetical protein ES288_D13G156600v1 [Gossypium darwinii]TYI47106.1 hypothetical protein E1A91_D13G150000v1 [Gossypium mustelinum]